MASQWCLHTCKLQIFFPSESPHMLLAQVPVLTKISFFPHVPDEVNIVSSMSVSQLFTPFPAIKADQMSDSARQSQHPASNSYIKWIHSHNHPARKGHTFTSQRAIHDFTYAMNLPSKGLRN